MVRFDNSARDKSFLHLNPEEPPKTASSPERQALSDGVARPRRPNYHRFSRGLPLFACYVFDGWLNGQRRLGWTDEHKAL